MYFLIPPGIFILCLALQFLFLRRIRQALVANHPDFWLKLSANAWWGVDGALARMAFWGGFGKYRLNDPELDRRILHFRLLWILAFLSWLALVGYGIIRFGSANS